MKHVREGSEHPSWSCSNLCRKRSFLCSIGQTERTSPAADPFPVARRPCSAVPLPSISCVQTLVWTLMPKLTTASSKHNGDCIGYKACGTIPRASMRFSRAAAISNYAPCSNGRARTTKLRAGAWSRAADGWETHAGPFSPAGAAWHRMPAILRPARAGLSGPQVRLSRDAPRSGKGPGSPRMRLRRPR